RLVAVDVDEQPTPREHVAVLERLSQWAARVDAEEKAPAVVPRLHRCAHGSQVAGRAYLPFLRWEGLHEEVGGRIGEELDGPPNLCQVRLVGHPLFGDRVGFERP